MTAEKENGVIEKAIEKVKEIVVPKKDEPIEDPIVANLELTESGYNQLMAILEGFSKGNYSRVDRQVALAWMDRFDQNKKQTA